MEKSTCSGVSNTLGTPNSERTILQVLWTWCCFGYWFSLFLAPQGGWRFFRNMEGMDRDMP